MSPPLRLKDAITSRLKIMAKLTSLKAAGRKTAHHDQVQGRREEKRIDFRVSTVPTLYGAKIVLRLLDQRKPATGHDEAGLRAESLTKFERNI